MLNQTKQKTLKHLFVISSTLQQSSITLGQVMQVNYRGDWDRCSSVFSPNRNQIQSRVHATHAQLAPPDQAVPDFSFSKTSFFMIRVFVIMSELVAFSQLLSVTFIMC